MTMKWIEWLGIDVTVVSNVLIVRGLGAEQPKVSSEIPAKKEQMEKHN